MSRGRPRRTTSCPRPSTRPPIRRHGLPVVLVNATGRAPGRTEEGAGHAGSIRAADDWTEIVDLLERGRCPVVVALRP